MLSLFVIGCDDCMEKTCEFRQETLFVCVLCGIGWQQTMGGQGRCKHSMEKGNKTLQDEYKKGSSKAKKDKFVVLVASIVDCVELGACRDQQLLFNFRSASDYIMVGFVFLLVLGYIKG